MVGIGVNVAENDCRSLQPGRQSQRGQVRNEVEVSVSELPIGEPVAIDRVHLHVDGQQVVAAMRTRRHGVLEEERGVEPLAVEPPVVVGERDDHRVDRVVDDRLFERIEIEQTTHVLRHQTLASNRVSTSADTSARRLSKPARGKGIEKQHDAGDTGGNREIPAVDSRAQTAPRARGRPQDRPP